MPVIGRLMDTLNVNPLRMHIADGYCVFKAGKGRFEIIDARFASPLVRTYITGTVGFDGTLNLVAVTRIGEDVIRRIPGLGALLDKFEAKMWRGLVRTEIHGTIDDPRPNIVSFGNIATNVLDFFTK